MERKTAREGTPVMASASPISRELQRFVWLIRQLKELDGMKAVEIASKTGIDYSHLTKLSTPERYGYTGLSVEILRKSCNALGISADYFLEDYDGERIARHVYSLDAKRKQVWQSGMDDRVHAVEQEMRELRALLVSSLDRKDAEIDRLRNELRQARAAEARTRRPK